MKRGPEISDSQRKKLVGELLRNADKLLKGGDYEQALTEVEKSLELEPGNFYAQAYRERITALRDRHAPAGSRPAAVPAGQSTGATSGLAAPAPPPPPAPMTELTEATGARIEEVTGTGEEEEEPAGRDIAGLKEQLDRERASHHDEAARQAEAMARESLENELRQRETADRLRAAEQQATADALAGVAAEAIPEFTSRAAGTFDRLLRAGDLNGAFREVAAIGIVDPDNSRLAEMTARLDAATLAAMQPAGGDARTTPREIPLQWYGNLLRSAWSEGTPNRVQAEAVAEAKKRFGVTADEEQALLGAIRKEIVTEALKAAYSGGEPDPETKGFLETLARELAVGDIDALRATVSG
jgi:hypothetical protein